METVKRRFELKQTPGVAIGSDELVADLHRVAAITGRSTVTFREYAAHGRYSTSTYQERFQSWNNALRAAGFGVSNELAYERGMLLENILQLWIARGRQPTRKDLTSSDSSASAGPYSRVFGSWRKALEEFVMWANESEDITGDARERSVADEHTRSQGPRDPNLRLRFAVMKRDQFKCNYCGKSPATHVGVELVLDHVVPWSKGGRTIEGNLRTACRVCNAGKSDVH